MIQETKDCLVSLREELIRQLEFVQDVIEEDRKRLESYREDHGDLNRRPRIGSQGYGQPTASKIVPAVVEYKSTIKSILDSIQILDKVLEGKPVEEFYVEDMEDEFNASEWLKSARNTNQKRTL